MTQEELEQEVMDTLSQEIVRELLSEVGAPTDDAFVATMWNMVKPNPWDAGILYQLLRHQQEQS